jgi:hypothetical protein
MCLVCGNLTGEPHWTERRLDSLAGGGLDEESRRRRDRFRRIRLLNRVLGGRRLAVHDECGATRYVLSDGRGHTEVLEHLGELWPAVQRLLGGGLDPLDEELVSSLSGVVRTK